MATVSIDHWTRRRLILAGIAGNVMEWYDFAVYGYFANVMAKHFFPSESPTVSLIEAFGAFAAGFLMRPFGGLVFGHIGDRLGRKAALTLSVLAMAIPTFLIGVLPDYQHIGVAAPVLIVVLRMIQGLSVGGEFTTSIVFLVEGGLSTRRGLSGSWAGWGATSGCLLGSAVGAALTTFVPPETIHAWAWRVPFLLGLLVGLAGLYIRKHIPETAPAAASAEATRSPIAEAFRTEWREILRVAALNLLLAVGFYLLFVYSVVYFRIVSHATEEQALQVNTLSMVVLLAISPLAGALSDRIGRKPVLLVGSAGVLLGAWPMFTLMHHPDRAQMLLGQILLTLPFGAFAGVIPATMVEMHPARVRCTAVSVGYNLCLGIVGGTTPMVATWLIERTHDDLAPAFFLMGAAAISFVVTLTLRETTWEPLR